MIDIKIVEKIISDFSNRKIEIFDFKGNRVWFNYYNTESTFNKISKELNKKFAIEVHRRSLLKQR